MVELGLESLFRQFHSISGHSGETDLKRVSFRPDCPHLNRLSRRPWWSHNRLGRKVERYPQHVSVFDVEKTVFVEVVGLSAQRAAHDLLAEQLGPESANAQHVADRVCIPSFGEHRYRHHATNRIPQPA